MSKDLVFDMAHFHKYYGLTEVFENMDEEKRKVFLKFRADCVQEEVDELQEAIENNDAEEVVDALIDVTVFALGTLDAYGVDAQKAWDEVLVANLGKKVGIKEGRPNPFGLPDLLKPEGWTAPSHEGNHGRL